MVAYSGMSYYPKVWGLRLRFFGLDRINVHCCNDVDDLLEDCMKEGVATFCAPLTSTMS